MAAREHEYTDDKIKTLSSLEHIRLRTGMYIGRTGTGSHYDDDNGSSNPSGMSGESSHSSRRMGVYVVYEVGSETYVRRSGVWSDVGPDVTSGVAAYG